MQPIGKAHNFHCLFQLALFFNRYVTNGINGWINEAQHYDEADNDFEPEQKSVECVGWIWESLQQNK